MKQETFIKAQEIDDRIALLNYAINNAQKIRTEFQVFIVGRNSRGDERNLAILKEDDPLRLLLSDALLERYQEGRKELQEQFDNL